jgi:branched-chain amino acid transport system ATP-binding protein
MTVAGTPHPPTLDVAGAHKRFGGVPAVVDVSLQVVAGGVSGLIGPNGAGKSTLLSIASGFVRPDAGSVRLDGAELVGKSPVRISRLGLARTFQQAAPLAGLTVLDNVLVGLHRAYRGGPLAALLRTPRMRRQERELTGRARALLAEVGLDEKTDVDAADLTFGQLRLLEIARSLASGPRVLLLDEPAAGLNRVESDRVAQVIVGTSRRGVGVLVVDHDVPFLLDICQHITCMDSGKVIASGTPSEIEKSPAVRAAYLG